MATVSLHKINVMKPPEECRLQSQKMTGKREIEREREVWCEKTKAGISVCICICVCGQVACTCMNVWVGRTPLICCVHKCMWCEYLSMLVVVLCM